MAVSPSAASAGSAAPAGLSVSAANARNRCSVSGSSNRRSTTRSPGPCSTMVDGSPSAGSPRADSTSNTKTPCSSSSTVVQSSELPTARATAVSSAVDTSGSDSPVSRNAAAATNRGKPSTGQAIAASVSSTNTAPSTPMSTGSPLNCDGFHSSVDSKIAPVASTSAPSIRTNQACRTGASPGSGLGTLGSSTTSGGRSESSSTNAATSSGSGSWYRRREGSGSTGSTARCDGVTEGSVSTSTVVVGAGAAVVADNWSATSGLLASSSIGPTMSAG